MVTDLAALGSSTQSNVPDKPNALKSLSDNYETFLKLLTEQLKNQDPLQPQDASEFTNQLVQFSQVEQQISSNDKLDKLISSTNQNRPIQALSYIGKVVDMQGSGLALQDGKGQMTITLPSKAAEASVEFYDSTGVLVRSMPMPTTAGFHDLTWDGKGFGGQQVPDGFYQIKVRATDSAGESIQSLIETSGTVTGVDMSNGETMLIVGNMAVRPENVLSVRERRGT